MRLRVTLRRTFVLALFSFGFISIFVFLITKNNEINHDEYKKSDYGHQKVTENNIQSHLVATDTPRRNDSIVKTKLEDVFISIKTTSKFHKTRLGILVNTWIPDVIDQVYVFTDADDIELQKRFPANHVTNTHCPTGHNSKGLSCKMASEFEGFFKTNKSWFCHFDDDNYVNVHNLIALLQKYNYSDDWYLGKPSLNHQMRVVDRAFPGQNRAFWFATGGAGFCISQGLARNMKPHVAKGGFMNLSKRIGAPDDCIVGYLINNLLHTNLTITKKFYSHLEEYFTHRTRLDDMKEAITLSYQIQGERKVVVKIEGFSFEDDATRLYSVHCFLKPYTPICINSTVFRYK